MIASFRRDNSNRIIITGADRAEALLIKQMVDNAKEGTVSLSEFLDVEGDVFGLAVDVTPKTEPVENTVNESE